MSYGDNPESGQSGRVAVISLGVTILAMPILVELAVLMTTFAGFGGTRQWGDTGQFLLALFFYFPLLSLLGVMVFPLQLLLTLILTTWTGAYLSGWPGINERHSQCWIWCSAGALIGLLTIVAMQITTGASLPINRGLVYPGMTTGVLCLLLWRWWMRKWVARARRQANMDDGQLLSNEEL